MRFVTLDFETYYSKEYSLTKMSTEDYVKDPRFEVILVGIKVNNEPKYWITGTKAQIRAKLLELELEKCMVLGHHMMFDGLVLVIQFGIVCGFYCDTRLLAQAALRPFVRSVSLDSCLKHIDLGIKKGNEVQNMIGRTRDSLSREELTRYAEYCMTDVEGTYRLFKYFAPQFPRDELHIIDMTLRMYLCPVLELDSKLLAELLQHVIAKKEQAIKSLPSDVTTADLMSNPKLAKVLERFGVPPDEIPKKISPTTGNQTFAFAKTDLAWKNFEETWADDPQVSAILAARTSSKSTLEQTRTQRLLDDSMKHAKFRVPLLYYAAHTGRYGGTDGLNVQNFPRVTNSKMRFAIRAPKDHVIIAADLSQIECRLTAWLAKQTNLLDGFRNREDVYAAFATTAYKKHVEPRKQSKERFVGKTCVLGMGFGVGAAKLQASLRKEGVKIDIIEAEHLVKTYRETYSGIPRCWRDLDQMISIMADGRAKYKWGPVTFAKNCVILPNDMTLVYHNLRLIESEERGRQWVYDFGEEVRTLWGGKVLENIVQALDFVLIKEYMMKIKHTIGLYLVMQNHDELDYCVHKDHAEKVAAVLKKIMSVPPTWGPDLPVEVEVNYGPTFGDCK